MEVAQIDDVELISIKTKSLQDLDNEINSQANNNKNLWDKNFKAREHNKCNEFFNKLHQQSAKEAIEDDGNDVDDDDGDDHYESAVRYVAINKSPNGACGFHLTRSKWDPYPWVSAVDKFTPAADTDLKAGDCVLEVNGCDVLGLRITEIAKLVKSSQHQVTLLLWSSNCNTKCDKESLCAAPMPRTLQRLSLVVQTVLNLIECPVCLDTITPPAMQCQNGHLLCVNCRIRAEKCPVCRDRYFPRPALIAEQIQSAITSAFNLCRNEDKVRQKIFGRHNRQRHMVKATLDYCWLKKQHQQLQQNHQVHKFLKADNTLTEDVSTAITTTNRAASNIENIIDGKTDRKVVKDKFFKSARSGSSSKTTYNKFLTKLLNSRAHSMENLTNGHNNTTNIVPTTTTTTAENILNTCHTRITSAISQLEMLDMQQQQQQEYSSHTAQVGEQKTLFKDFTAMQQNQQFTSAVTNTNQFNDFTRNFTRNLRHNLLTHKPPSPPNSNAIENDLNINSKRCCMQTSNNKLKHFSLLSDEDLTRSKESITCLLESPHIIMNDKNKISWPTVACETTSTTCTTPQCQEL